MAKPPPLHTRRIVEKTDQHWGVGASIPRTTHANVAPVHWHGTDSLENFEKNKPKGWTKESITYVTNSHGYRSQEFIDDNNFTVASYGDSRTWGTGSPIEHTWPEIYRNLLQNLTGAPINNFNFGRGGVSMDNICRTVFCTVPVVKPNLALLYLPNMNRREIYDDDGYAIMVNPMNKDYTTYYEEYVNYHESKNNFLKNLMFMKTVFELHEVPWLFATWDQDIKKEVCNEVNYVDGHRLFDNDLARDCSHPSIKAYTHLANSFLEKYKKLYS